VQKVWKRMNLGSRMQLRYVCQHYCYWLLLLGFFFAANWDETANLTLDKMFWTDMQIYPWFADREFNIAQKSRCIVCILILNSWSNTFAIWALTLLPSTFNTWQHITSHNYKGLTAQSFSFLRKEVCSSRLPLGKKLAQWG